MGNATTTWREEKPPGKITVRFVTRFNYRCGKISLWPKQLRIWEFLRMLCFGRVRNLPTLSYLQRRRGRGRSLLAALIFKEKLSRQKTLALAVGLAAVALLNRRLIEKNGVQSIFRLDPSSHGLVKVKIVQFTLLAQR